MVVNMIVVNAASVPSLHMVVSEHQGYPQVVCEGKDERLGFYAVLAPVQVRLDAEGDDTVLSMILDHYADQDDVTGLIAHDGTMITLV